MISLSYNDRKSCSTSHCLSRKSLLDVTKCWMLSPLMLQRRRRPRKTKLIIAALGRIVQLRLQRHPEECCPFKITRMLHVCSNSLFVPGSFLRIICLYNYSKNPNVPNYHPIRQKSLPLISLILLRQLRLRLQLQQLPLSSKIGFEQSCRNL